MTIHFLQPTVLELGSCVGRCMVAPAAEFKEVVVLCARTLKRTIPTTTTPCTAVQWTLLFKNIIGNHILISVFIPIVKLGVCSKIAA